MLETGRFMRVGSTVSQEADVRIIAATNRPPFQALAAGKLREDLLYRLNVFPIELPPLRERLSDVALLAEHFLVGIGEQEGQARRFTPAALAKLATYPWPGNVRELRNAVQRAYVMATHDTIDEAWLPGTDEAGASQEQAVASSNASALLAPGSVLPVESASPAESVTLPIGTSLAKAERLLMLATLRHYNHQKERTAAALGISLKTLYNRLKEYAAEDERSEPPAAAN